MKYLKILAFFKKKKLFWGYFCNIWKLWLSPVDFNFWKTHLKVEVLCLYCFSKIHYIAKLGGQTMKYCFEIELFFPDFGKYYGMLLVSYVAMFPVFLILLCIRTSYLISTKRKNFHKEKKKKENEESSGAEDWKQSDVAHFFLPVLR